MRPRYLLLILLLSPLFSINITAQEVEKKEAVEREFKPHSTLGFVIGHAHLFSGVDENGDNQVTTLPSWAIDYTYHISSK